METIEYQIAPVLMGGVVKQVADDFVKINLYGRLGVLYVPRGFIMDNIEVEPGHELSFYFSYVQVVEDVFDYDYSPLQAQQDFSPSLIGGTIIAVNDTAVKIQIGTSMGTAAVPRRWVFTASVLKIGQNVEFYLSCMKISRKIKL